MGFVSKSFDTTDEASGLSLAIDLISDIDSSSHSQRWCGFGEEGADYL